MHGRSSHLCRTSMPPLPILIMHCSSLFPPTYPALYYRNVSECTLYPISASDCNPHGLGLLIYRSFITSTLPSVPLSYTSCRHHVIHCMTRTALTIGVACSGHCLSNLCAQISDMQIRSNVISTSGNVPEQIPFVLHVRRLMSHQEQ